MINENALVTSTNIQFGSRELDSLWWNCTSFDLPSINLAPPQVASRSGALVNLGADVVDFDDVTINILLDKEWKVFDELYQYFISRLNVETGQFNKEGRFDLWVELFSGEGNSIKKFWFYNCRLTHFGDIAYDTTDSEDTLQTLSMSFLYDYFDYDNMLKDTRGINDEEPTAY